MFSQSSKRQSKRLLVELWRLIVAWWRVDRVRASPDEGRLLRLEPPCLLLIEGRPVELVERLVGQRPAGPYLLYRCRTSCGDGELLVEPRGLAGEPLVHWSDADGQRVLSSIQIEVYAAHHRGR